MISDREQVDRQLQEIIDAKTSDWGFTVMSVEIRDVRLPGMLEDAMSRKAQADRESEARVILAHSELAVADEMEQASACTGQPHCPADSRDEHDLRVDQGARRADGRAE